MKNCPFPFVAILIVSFYETSAYAQKSLHMPLKGITVRLESLTAIDTLDTNRSKIISFEIEATTNDDGEFMFGFVPPGRYAVGCAYTACYTAFRNSKQSGTLGNGNNDTASEEPLMQISINACEGMVCHVAVQTMMPDSWNAQTPPTTITKDWTNSRQWLTKGGGIMLRIDDAHAVISGKIEVQ